MPALPVRRGAGRQPSGDLAYAVDETRNYGETERELLLRPEAEVVFGRDGRRYCPTARFVRFLQAEAADPSPRTHRPAPRDRERNSGAPIAVAHLVQTYDRGPRRPRRWSTWLLLPPRTSSGFDAGGVAAPSAKQ
jgi:hypothetical protein